MQTYVATFGLGHKLHNKYQPIIAESKMEAQKIMLGNYGQTWAFLYTEKDFKRKQLIGFFRDLEPLSTIKKGMI